MSRKTLMLAVAGLIGLAASADVLYWQVNNAAADAEGATKDTYSYAILKASTTADTSGTQYYVQENQSASGASMGTAISRSTFDNGGYVAGVMDAAKILSADGNNTPYGGDSLSSLYFFLELYDSSGNWVGQTSPAQAYDSLVNSGTIVSGFNSNFTGVNNALGGSGTYQSVPEPTSGLLMLVGLGALALRRRKVA